MSLIKNLVFGELTLGKIDERIHLKSLADLEFGHNLLKKLMLVNDSLVFSMSQWKQVHF